MIKLTELRVYPKYYIQNIKNCLNLTEEENKIFDLTIKGYPTNFIADEIGISTRTLFRRLNLINQKLLLLDYDKIIKGEY